MSVERINPGSNAWKESYASHAERYRHILPYCRDLNILDAACGVGYGTQMIAQSGAKKVTGVDLSSDALKIARNEFSHPCAEFIQGNCLELPFDDETFDAAITFETIEHLESPSEFLKELYRVIRSNGTLFLSCPNILTHSKSPLNQKENPWHVSEMTLKEITTSVDERFEIETIFHQTPSLAHICASHLEHLEVCVSRSLVIKIENALRGILGKERIRPLRSLPSLSQSQHNHPYPILPITDEGDPAIETAQVFLLKAKRRN